MKKHYKKNITAEKLLAGSAYDKSVMLYVMGLADMLSQDRYRRYLKGFTAAR